MPVCRTIRQSDRRSAAGGSPAAKNRLRRESGERLWKKRRNASRSCGRASRTVAVVPSRSTRRDGVRDRRSRAATAGIARMASGPGDGDERVGRDELALGMPDRQDRAWRCADDPFGDAAHQQRARTRAVHACPSRSGRWRGPSRTATIVSAAPIDVTTAGLALSVVDVLFGHERPNALTRTSSICFCTSRQDSHR